MTTPVLIQPRHDVFPNNAIVEICDELAKVNTGVPVYTRPIRVGDPADIGPA